MEIQNSRTMAQRARGGISNTLEAVSQASTSIANPFSATITGSGGDDFFAAASAPVNYDGGSGSDIVSYHNARAGVSSSLLIGVGLSGDALGDTYINIEGLEGSPFGDILVGGTGSDELVGGLAGDDVLYGGTGDDLLDGGEDNDWLYGESGNDKLVGGDGNDVMDGGLDHDTLDGGSGNDLLSGGFGNDQLKGGAGKDVLDGGFGEDVLDGGTGSDILAGGLGADTFVFAELGGTDLILDFRSGEDRIDLSGIDAVAGGDTDSFQWIGQDAFSGQAGELRHYSQGGSWFVEGDITGDGRGDLLLQLNTSIAQTDVIFA